MRYQPTNQLTNQPTDQPTDRLTDRPTDKAGCKVACMRLKMKRERKWNLLEGRKGRFGWGHHPYTHNTIQRF